MKTPIFVFFAVFASALVAESQTPKSIPAAKPVASAAEVVADEIPLEDDEGGKVELTSSGDTVNIVCEDAPISDILKQFRRVVKANILSTDSTNLHKRVSISLYDTPWVESLKAVLGMGGFALDERNGIYRVSPEQAENPIVRTKSFTLNHANADETAKLLNESFGEKDKKTGKAIGGVASVFKDANVIVVKGTDKVIRDCEEVIEAVDRAPEQVYIQARFIELSNEAMRKLGIDWSSLENYKVEAKNMRFGIEHNYGRLGNYGYNQPNGSGSVGGSFSRSADGSSQSGWTIDSEGKSVPTGSGSQGSSRSTGLNGSFSRGSTIGSLVPTAIPQSTALLDTIGGTEQAHGMEFQDAMTFSGQLSADNFALALSAFESMGDAKIFSNPRIIVSNGKKAQVDMTRKYPNVRVTSNRTGGISDSLDITAQLEQIPGEEGALFAKEVFFSWGIALEVTPRIAPDGLINVEIIPSISDCTEYAEVQGGEGSAYSKYPVIDMQRLITDFTMKDGSTAVIGGLTQTKEQDVDTGIPYLRKIPWIGQKLFGWTSRQKIQKEIIVFVTVGIANPRKLKTDVGLPKNAVLGREYVEGKAFEPGDRGGVNKAMKLDMRDVDDEERHEKVKEPEPEVIEKVVEKEVIVEKPVEKVVEKIVEKPVIVEKVVEKPTAIPQPGVAKMPAGVTHAGSVTAPVAVAAASSEGPAKSDPTDPKQESTGPAKAFVPPEEPEPVVSEPARKIRHGRR